MANKFYIKPFAVSGTRVAVPDNTQSDGSVSFNDGYGADYSLNPASAPAALNIERTKFNQIIYDITNNIRSYQIMGAPDFITSSDNAGTPFSYAQGARVLYSGVVYESLTGSNTDLPSVTTSWKVAGMLSNGTYSDITVDTNGAHLNFSNFAANTILANATTSAAHPTPLALTANSVLFMDSSHINVLSMAANTILLRGATGDIVAGTLGSGFSIVAGALTYSGAPFPVSTASGTNTITATYSPTTALTDKLILRLISAGINTSTTPTFSADGNTARNIVRYGGQPLAPGDMGNAGYVTLLQYNLANTRWELLNPAHVFYESAQTTVAASTNVTFTHGLGAIPKWIQVVLVNITADLGYSPGDEVPVLWQYFSGGVSLTIWSSSTSIGIALTNTPTITTKTTGTLSTITLANWKWIARASLS